MMGKPCIRGTRIPVCLILEKLAGGATAEEIMDDYPRLTRGHVQACLAHATRARQG